MLPRSQRSGVMVPIPLEVAQEIAWPIDDSNREAVQREVAAATNKVVDCAIGYVKGLKT